MGAAWMHEAGAPRRGHRTVELARDIVVDAGQPVEGIRRVGPRRPRRNRSAGVASETNRTGASRTRQRSDGPGGAGRAGEDGADPPAGECSRCCRRTSSRSKNAPRAGARACGSVGSEDRTMSKLTVNTEPSDDERAVTARSSATASASNAPGTEPPLARADLVKAVAGAMQDMLPSLREAFRAEMDIRLQDYVKLEPDPCTLR